MSSAQEGDLFERFAGVFGRAPTPAPPPPAEVTVDLELGGQVFERVRLSVEPGYSWGCTECGRFGFPKPTVCYWCRHPTPEEVA